MLELSTLMTHPLAQHHGYASALVRMVTSEADRQGRGTYLHSSNRVTNLGFYESLGFVEVGMYEVGGEEGVEKVTVGIVSLFSVFWLAGY